MRIQIGPQEEFVLHNIVAMVGSQQDDAQRGSYSTALEFAISELVKTTMRTIARGQSGSLSANILETAMRSNHDKLARLITEHQFKFDLDNYFENVGRQLEFAGREINDLRDRLIESRRQEKLGVTERSPIGSPVPFEIIELGLRGSVEAVLAYPLADRYDIDTDALPEDGCVVKGEWFPLEISADDLTFAVDDDGTIFTSTENFPSELVALAKRRLRVLAERLYVRAMEE